MSEKPVIWVASSKEDLSAFPPDVKRVLGQGIFEAQIGGKHINAKPLKGFGGSKVVEIVDDFEGDTYRAVYTVKLADFVYVLHAFQKKSTKGIETPKHVMDLINTRLKAAEAQYEEHCKENKKTA